MEVKNKKLGHKSKTPGLPFLEIAANQIKPSGPVVQPAATRSVRPAGFDQAVGQANQFASSVDLLVLLIDWEEQHAEQPLEHRPWSS
ncbi:hypothetical protein U1Q18_022566 [Sarracenia purpurea var. burkii]